MIYKEDCRTIQELVDRVDRVDRQLKHRYVPSFTSSKDPESVDRLYSINWGPISGMKGELSEESTILNPLAGNLLTSWGRALGTKSPIPLGDGIGQTHNSLIGWWNLNEKNFGWTIGLMLGEFSSRALEGS